MVTLYTGIEIINSANLKKPKNENKELSLCHVTTSRPMAFERKLIMI